MFLCVKLVQLIMSLWSSWGWYGGLSLKTMEQLWVAAHVANLTSPQGVKSTSWVDYNQNMLSIDFILLSHQIHVLKLNPDVLAWCHSLGSKLQPAKCFWLLFGMHPPVWQVTSPPLVFSYFNWLVKNSHIDGCLAASDHFKCFFFFHSPAYSTVVINKDPTITTCQMGD